MRQDAPGLLAAIVRFSLRFRGVVLVLAGILIVYGALTLSRSKYDVFPEFAPPQVSIQTEAPGLAPEQVEVLATQPIENAINGLPGLQALRSQSIQGLSVITITFNPGSDIYRDRQNLGERLGALATQLPQGVQVPVMSPLTSSTSVVLDIGLTSDKRSLMELRTLADWTLKPALLAVPGVAKVAVFGGDTKEYQVQIRPEQLLKYNLAVDDVLTAARRATGVRGAGFIDTPNQRIVLQSDGQALAVQEIAGTIVRHQAGGNVTLGDVAQVVVAPEPPIGASSVMGHPAVRDAAVVGIPHAKWQERPLALVVLKPGQQATQEQLQEHLTSAFAKWQLPDQVLFVEAIPKTSVGKLDKKRIRAEHAGRYAE